MKSMNQYTRYINWRFLVCVPCKLYCWLLVNLFLFRFWFVGAVATVWHKLCTFHNFNCKRHIFDSLWLFNHALQLPLQIQHTTKCRLIIVTFNNEDWSIVMFFFFEIVCAFLRLIFIKWTETHNVPIVILLYCYIYIYKKGG